MNLPARATVAVLSFYKRRISPLLPPSCRFTPTCSEYARQAVLERGLVLGLMLTTGRLLRCAPWHPGGLELP